jgi:hypothetical protein
MHERLCTHAESVAFFGGGAREKAVSISTLRYLMHFFFLGFAYLRCVKLRSKVIYTFSPWDNWQWNEVQFIYTPPPEISDTPLHDPFNKQ